MHKVKDFITKAPNYKLKIAFIFFYEHYLVSTISVKKNSPGTIPASSESNTLPV